MEALLNGPQISGAIPATAGPQSPPQGPLEVTVNGSPQQSGPLPPPPLPSQATYIASSLNTLCCPLWSRRGQQTFSIKGQIENILGFIY